jgi:hypothetical protein
VGILECGHALQGVRTRTGVVQVEDCFEASYSMNKGILPPDMIENMRKCYKECDPFLSTIAQQPEQISIVKEAKIEALKSIAKSLLGRELGKEEELELFENELKRLREGRHNPQRIGHGRCA